MGQPYVGEIRLFAGNFAPQGWFFCDGQLLSISEFEAFYNLIGTTYGGDGQTTFGLPNLTSRVPINQGNGPGLAAAVLGASGGVENVTLNVQQIPSHSHVANGSIVGTSTSPVAGLPSADPSGSIAPWNTAPTPNATMNTNALGNTGGNQPHNNIQPFQAVNYIISAFGVFPSQG